MSNSILSTITDELEVFFEPVSSRLRAMAIVDLMAELGWLWPEGVTPDVDEVIDALDTLIDALAQLADSAEVSEYVDVLMAAVEVVVALKELGDHLPNPANFAGDVRQALEVVVADAGLLGERAVSLLVYRYLESRLPAVLGLLTLIGTVRVSHVPPTGSKPGFDLVEINWRNFSRLFTEPGELFADLYDWNKTSALKIDELLRGLEALARGVGLPAAGKTTPRRLERSLVTALGGDADSLRLGRQLEIPLLQTFAEDVGSTSVGLRVIGVLDPATPSADLKGLAIVPYGSAGLTLGVDVSEDLRFETGGSFAVDFAIVIFPGGRAQFLDQLLGAGGLDMSLSMGLIHSRQSGPLLVFGSEQGSRFEYTGLRADFGLSGSPHDPDVFFELSIKGAKLVIQGSDGDGFLAKILPDDPITMDFDAELGFSIKRGFYGGASGSIEFEIPLHVEIGPISIESVAIALRLPLPDLDAFRLQVAVTAGAELGPLSASIRRVGVLALLSFGQDGRGNLGDVDLSIGFLPPTGAGLGVNAGPIAGGGFIEFFPKEERYSGSLALTLGDISITAVGIITTRLSDGKQGVSILISIGIIFDPPIELSMGFTLSGVGGLVGINRTMVLEELQKGIRAGTLDSLLFPNPETVVANAQNIIRDMGTVFPPHEGRFVVGPMVRIGWGSPKNVIFAEIGVFISFPEPIAIALLGKLTASFPSPEEETVRINLHILGTLSLEKKELTFQASLYDSEILGISLFGDSAMLLNWGGRPEMILSMGGFHPKFTPPPPEYIFGGMRRMGLMVSWGSEIFLMCQSYMALTPNSLQFGADVEVIVNVGALSANGSFDFDALIYFDPFSFEITAEATVFVRIGEWTLADAHVDFLLSGPTPWHAQGSATIKLLGVDVSGSFDITWGQRLHTTIPAVDPWPKLRSALVADAAWSAVMPKASRMVEKLQPAEANGSAGLVVHPAGSLEVRQTVVPFGVRLRKFGTAPVKNHNYFELHGFEIGNATAQHGPAGYVEEHFARGQFDELSEDTRLSAPSFERMVAGGKLQADPISFSTQAQCRRAGYESAYLIDEKASVPSKAPGGLDGDISGLVSGSAGALNSYKRSGAGRFMVPDAETRITTCERSFYIVDVETLKPHVGAERAIRARSGKPGGLLPRSGPAQDAPLQDSGSGEHREERSRWRVQQVLDEFLQSHPELRDRLIIVADYEVATEAA